MRMKLMPTHGKEGPSRRVAFTALMTALAAAAGYLEMLFPIDIFGIPGVKPGLANIVSVIVLYLFGPAYAFMVMAVRVILIGFMFGNMYSIIYGLTGGVFSVTVMCLLKKTGLFKCTGVSAAGGAAHNIGQLLVARVTLGELNLVYYIPVLVVFGTLFGSIMGVLSGMVYDRISKGDNNDRIFEREA